MPNGILLLAALLLAGCAGYLRPSPNPCLKPPTVEVRGDTAVYRSAWRNGRPRSEVTLVAGRAEGSMRMHREDSTLEEVIEFRAGMKEGTSIAYFPYGGKSRVRVFAGDSNQVDRMVDFDSTGMQISEWIPLEGPRTGIYLLRRNGKVFDSTFYRRGVQEGLSFTLGADGDTVEKSFYSFGREDSVGFKTKRSRSGQRSTESILRTIRRNTPDLRHPYNAHLARGRFGGKVTVHFAIAPDGRVTWVYPTGDTTRKPAFVRDILAMVQQWRFEPIDTRDNDIITVPFTFSE